MKIKSFIMPSFPTFYKAYKDRENREYDFVVDGVKCKKAVWEINDQIGSLKLAAGTYDGHFFIKLEERGARPFFYEYVPENTSEKDLQKWYDEQVKKLKKFAKIYISEQYLLDEMKRDSKATELEYAFDPSLVTGEEGQQESVIDIFINRR